MNKLLDILTIRQRRFLEGCFYLGCFTPVAFAILALLIVAKAIYDWLTAHK